MESASAKQLEPDHSYSMLPESLPYPSQAYGLQSPSYVPGTIDTAKEMYMVPPPGSDTCGNEAPLPARSQGRWARWPCLLLFGILIAIIAGLIGGFTGKAISTAHTSSHTNLPHIPSTNSSTPNSSNSTLPIPNLNCPSSNGNTSFSAVTYRLYCNVNWVGSDIVAILAATPNDCMEACNTVNQYNEINNTCIGATYVPSWLNRTLAMERVDRPSNCFLKWGADGYPPNALTEETSVLCLEGKCPSTS